VGEVEQDSDVLAVGRENFDGGVVGPDITGVVLEPDVPADETVGASVGGAATVGRAAIEGSRRKKGCEEEIRERHMARTLPAGGNDLDTERLDPLVFLGDAGAEIAIVIRTLCLGSALGRVEETSRTIKLESAVGGSEIDADANANGVGGGAIVLRSLLSAVADAVQARALHELRVGSVELDLRDVRAGLGRREGPEIAEKKVGSRLIMALAEEVGIADGFVGEGRLQGEGRWDEEQSCSKDCETGAEGLGHGVRLPTK